MNTTPSRHVQKMVFREYFFLPPDDQIQLMIEQEDQRKLRVDQVMTKSLGAPNDLLFDDEGFDENEFAGRK